MLMSALKTEVKLDQDLIFKMKNVLLTICKRTINIKLGLVKYISLRNISEEILSVK